MNINIYHSESEEREKGSKKWMMMSLCVGSPQELIKKQDKRWSKRESGKRCCNSKQLSARWGNVRERNAKSDRLKHDIRYVIPAKNVIPAAADH